MCRNTARTLDCERSKESYTIHRTVHAHEVTHEGHIPHLHQTGGGCIVLVGNLPAWNSRSRILTPVRAGIDCFVFQCRLRRQVIQVIGLGNVDKKIRPKKNNNN